MTLNTTNFKKYGVRLYKQLSGSSYLDPEACADAYEMFVKRLRGYRDKHPEIGSVSGAFVRKCERWIRTDLIRRKKARRARETAELELAKRAFDLAAPAGGGTGNTVLFVKLEGFFRHWMKEYPKAADYIGIFLLHRAWSLSPERVKRFAQLVPGKKSEFIRNVKRVKKIVAGSAAALAAEHMEAAQYWYARSVRAELAAQEVTGKKRAAALARREDCEAKRRRALARLGNVTYQPTREDLAKIAGVSVERVTRALRTCEKEIKEYFG
jgi:hypothetical protein